MSNLQRNREMHEIIASVTELTEALARALERNDFTACDELITDRGRQFADLDRRLQTCTEAELAAHHGQLAELAKLDTALQHRFAAVRDDLAATCRRIGGQGPPRSAATVAPPTCIDRKA